VQGFYLGYTENCSFENLQSTNYLTEEYI